MKLYIREAHSEQARSVFHKAHAHACKVINYVEFHTAVARFHRDHLLTDAKQALLKQGFTKSWPHYIGIPVSQPLLTRAAELGEAFALRSYDSVHLAATDMAARRTSESLVFACYDTALNQAAPILGLELLGA